LEEEEEEADENAIALVLGRRRSRR